ncbi:uncharacterized protein KQ657_001555 [Scheffersomyces spartinae]|uniref:RCC1/BLIP-II protein n=1 Tax=Scheffersomyces spartinae TaxID=45513 RepID=A0A9P7V7Q8_9ASCO|nr:uncharacterized protein KQ657_001555 [Scheffersomyces spartinae]KAG7192772.1 hypothetical protein KQ657_001555 [Scheffersomyces spartinae]
MIKHSVFPARNGPLRGVPIPLNVQSLNNWSIRLIHSTGFSFITLLQPEVDTKAQLYYTGYQWRDTPYSQSSVPPGPNERDVITTTSAPNTRLPAMISLPGYHPMNLTYSRDSTTNYHTPETAYLSPLMITGDDMGGKSDNESNIRKLDPLIQVECGRQHVMGMSGQGRIWVWDAGIPGHSAVELDIAKVIKSFSGGKLLRATKIRCSWNANSCYVPGLGIIVWNGRESVTEEGIKKVEFGQWAQLVPNTQYVKDYACVFEDIVYIDSMGRNINHYHEGKTEAISSVGLDLLSPHKEDVKLDQDEEEYSRLLACYDKFIATTTYSRTVVYNVREKSGVTIELPVEAAPLVDIAMGDYHYLALAADGELYAWGHESRGCGCLGVEAQRTNQDLNIPKPKLVQKPVPGKWLAVTAGGWQSAGIFVEDV